MDSWLKAKVKFNQPLCSFPALTQMCADSCTQEAITEDPDMLRGARQVFDAKKQELRNRLAALSEFADHVHDPEPHKNDTNCVTAANFEPIDPKYSSRDAVWPRSDHPVKRDEAHQSLASSVSPIQGFSRRPLSESELEFLSYERTNVSDAEFRISSAISKLQNQVAKGEGSGCSVSTITASLESDANLVSTGSSINASASPRRGSSMNVSTSPSKAGKSVRFGAERGNISGPSNSSSRNASATYSYIASLASSVQTLDESLNDERKLLLISQHQHHSSVAKIAELERTVEYLQAQCQRSEAVNQRIVQRTNALESALHTWNFQKMTQDSELHSTHQLVCHSALLRFLFKFNPLLQIAELNQQNIRLSNDLHVRMISHLLFLIRDVQPLCR